MRGVPGVLIAIALPVAAFPTAGCHTAPEGKGSAAAESGATTPTHERVSPRSAADYPWPRRDAACEALAWRFPAPEGHTRCAVQGGSWAEWLRYLPLAPSGTPVTFRDGTEVLPASSPDLAAVIDLDIRPNQECSDTILRLRAEYLRWAKRETEIRFELSGGGTIAWPEWKRGMRPREVGGSLSFHRTAGPDASRHSFERFLDTVFAWCGTYSLASEGKPVSPSDVKIGDFFVHGGSPGHAVLIVDMAADALGARKGLLLQGYMPAQSAHVLARDGEPWFDLDPDQPLDTPLWGAFDWTEVRRFDAE